MAQITDLHELLKHELKDLYSAETQMIDALPEMVENANSTELKKALREHLAVTKEQKKRLEQVQQMLGEEVKSNEDKGFFAKLFSSDEGEEHCRAMEGLIKEGKKMMGEDMEPEVMDAAIIAAAQKVEHYEISSYGTARAFALQLNLKQVARLLEQTLNEEYDADDSLTRLALSKVNIAAEDGMMMGRRYSSGNGKSNGNGKITPGNNSSAKKSVAGNKAASKKSASNTKKVAAKKTAAKKAPAPGKAAPKKTVAKKSSSNSKKAPAKKTASKKSSLVSKAAAKKAPAKKTAIKQPASRSAGKTKAGKSKNKR